MKTVVKWPVVILVCILLGAAGCAPGSTETPAATAASDPTATLEMPTAVPPTEPPLPTELPLPEGAPDALRLMGFAVQMQCTKAEPCLDGNQSSPDGARLLVYDLEGVQTSSEVLSRPGEVFHVWGWNEALSYFYLDYDSNHIQEIRRETILREYTLPGGHFFLGVPGWARFAATILPGITDSGLSEIQMIPGLGYIALASVPHELVLPVQAFQRDEYNLDIWYIEEPYGIGGDIVFPVWYGLHWLDGESPVEVLPKDLQFSAVSPDGRLVAYTAIPSGPMNVRDWPAGTETAFELLPGSDRGAGYAAFSSDGSHLAWVEASGSLANGDFANTLRIASLESGDILEWEPEQIEAFADREVIFFRPAGWLDSHTVLVEVNPTSKGDETLTLILDLLDSAPPQIVRGFFVGLVWSE